MIHSLARRLGTIQIRQHEPIGKHTSFRIGGPADAYVVVRSVEELVRTVGAARDLGIPHLLFGGASNLLVRDGGIRGLVIENRARGNVFDEGGVVADSGAPLAALGRKAAKAGLAGLEWAVDVPGTVGGAVVNNAGANGSDVAAGLRWAAVLDLDGRIRAYTPGDLEMAYRSSSLKYVDPLGPRPVVLRSSFALRPGEPLGLAESMARYSAYRRSTQPVGASAGSMFKNPADHAAGWYVDAAGLKGTQIGNARISDLHGNFVLNLGGATAADVLALVDLARRTVAERFGVTLELEIQVVGS